jgi:hypothetical protein
MLRYRQFGHTRMLKAEDRWSTGMGRAPTPRFGGKTRFIFSQTDRGCQGELVPARRACPNI